MDLWILILSLGALHGLFLGAILGVRRSGRPRPHTYLALLLLALSIHLGESVAFRLGFTAADERRFFVLEISDERQGDHAYFAAIEEQMKAGGLAAMLHDLLAFDLSNTNIRSVPATAALLENKERSLEPVEAWLHDVLQRKVIYGRETRDINNNLVEPRIELYDDTTNVTRELNPLVVLSHVRSMSIISSCASRQCKRSGKRVSCES